MTKNELLKAYQPREWTQYTVILSSPQHRELQALLRNDKSMLCCGEGSEYALDWWRRKRSLEGLVLFDVEQIIAMDMDKVYGVCDFGILTGEWNGHPAGSLIMSVFSGIECDPPIVTVALSS